MPQLYKPRKGWQNEHLAKSILSKFSFVVEPSAGPADDIGSDFFCTLFEIKNGSAIPRNSFAIQIKSNTNTINVTKNMRHLDNLEIPFFVGVVDNKNLKMKIFSGESIPHLLTMYGDPTAGNENAKIYIKLLDTLKNPLELFQKNGDKYYLNFPKILEIDARYDYEKTSSRIGKLFDICNKIQDNLASKRNCECTYEICETGTPRIYAGPGSYREYKKNFAKRLSESICSLKWGHEHVKTISRKEFELWERVYLTSEELGIKMPDIVKTVFSELKRSIEK